MRVLYGWCCLCGTLEPDSIDPHRPRNVLELLLANILEGDFETSLDILLHAARNGNPARLRQSLKPCRDIHAVAPYVGAVDDDVAGVDAHTELDPLLLRQVDVTFIHRALDFNGP